MPSRGTHQFRLSNAPEMPQIVGVRDMDLPTAQNRRSAGGVGRKDTRKTNVLSQRSVLTAGMRVTKLRIVLSRRNVGDVAKKDTRFLNVLNPRCATDVEPRAIWSGNVRRQRRRGSTLMRRAT